eukprot:763613-Hanusia_phi.AAC.1
MSTISYLSIQSERFPSTDRNAQYTNGMSRTNLRSHPLRRAMPVCKIETTGLKWDIHGDSQLQIGDLGGSFVSTSNRIVGEEVKVTVSDPILWVSEFRIPES